MISPVHGTEKGRTPIQKKGRKRGDANDAAGHVRPPTKPTDVSWRPLGSGQCLLAYATRHRTGRVKKNLLHLVTSFHGTHGSTCEPRGSRAVRLSSCACRRGGIADRIPVCSFLPAPACGRHREAGLAFPVLIIAVPRSNGRAQSPRTAFLSPLPGCFC